MRSNSAALIFGLLVLAMPAKAAVSAQSLYVDGAYIAAIEAGEAEGGTNGLAVAARAALADAARAALADAESRDMACLACLSRAEELARKAIAADPENAEAYILLVAALGRRARLMGFFQSQREGVAGQTDEAIAKALTLDPGSAFAMAVRGAWHIEVVRQAGRFLGRTLYGASVEEGKRYFADAMNLEPENLVIRYQYALVLEAYDFSAEGSEVEAALAAAVMGMPRNAYEGAIKARAEILLALLRGGRSDAFHERMRKFRGDE